MSGDYCYNTNNLTPGNLKCLVFLKDYKLYLLAEGEAVRINSKKQYYLNYNIILQGADSLKGLICLIHYSNNSGIPDKDNEELRRLNLILKDLVQLFYYRIYGFFVNLH